MTTDVTNALEVLVGEGKKFSTVEELAKGKLQSDTFIPVLEQQIVDLKTLVDDLQQKADRTEALERLMSELDNKNNGTNHGNPGDTSTQDKGNQPQTLTPEDIVNLIEQREQAKAAERNLAVVKDKLKQVYGERTDEVFKSKAAELGLTVEQLDALGRSSPTALLNLVGATKQPSTASATSSSTNTSALLAGDSPGGEVRNKAYYDKKKQELGTKAFVFNRDLQAQLHRDMSALGDAWDAA